MASDLALLLQLAAASFTELLCFATLFLICQKVFLNWRSHNDRFFLASFMLAALSPALVAWILRALLHFSPWTLSPISAYFGVNTVLICVLLLFVCRRPRCHFFLKGLGFAALFFVFRFFLALALLQSNFFELHHFGHDYLVYASLGKKLYAHFFLLGSNAEWVAGPEVLSKHSTLFSYLWLWPRILPQSGFLTADFYFKLITPLYSAASMFLVFFMLRKKGAFVLFLTALAFFSAKFWAMSSLQPHIDSIRIFFLLASYLFFSWSLQEKNRFELPALWALFAAISSGLHAIGLLFSMLQFAGICFFYIRHGNKKYLSCLLLGSILFVFGAGSYLMRFFKEIGQ